MKLLIKDEYCVVCDCDVVCYYVKDVRSNSKSGGILPADSEGGSLDESTLVVDLLIEVDTLLAQGVLRGRSTCEAPETALQNNEEKSEDPEAQDHLTIRKVGRFVSDSTGINIVEGRGQADRSKSAHGVEAENGGRQKGAQVEAAAHRLTHESNQARRIDEDAKSQDQGLDHKADGTNGAESVNFGPAISDSLALEIALREQVLVLLCIIRKLVLERSISE